MKKKEKMFLDYLDFTEEEFNEEIKEMSKEEMNRIRELCKDEVEAVFESLILAN